MVAFNVTMATKRDLSKPLESVSFRCNPRRQTFDAESLRVDKDTMPSHEMRPGEVKFTIPHGDDVDVGALQQIWGSTVVFETDSGQHYLVRDAGTEGKVELKGKEVRSP